MLPSNDDTWLTPEMEKRQRGQRAACAAHHRVPAYEIDIVRPTLANCLPKGDEYGLPARTTVASLSKQATRPRVRHQRGWPSHQSAGSAHRSSPRAQPLARCPIRVCPAFAAEGGGEGARGNEMTATATVAPVALAMATLPTWAGAAAHRQLDVTPGAKQGSVTPVTDATRAPRPRPSVPPRNTPLPLHGTRRGQNGEAPPLAPPLALPPGKAK